MKALNDALNKLDGSVFEDHWGRLHSLIDTLLDKLAGASFTRATYEIYGGLLFALYKNVVLL